MKYHYTAGTTLQEILIKTGFFVTHGMARRYIQQGAVRVNGKRVTEPDTKLDSGASRVMVGRRNHEWLGLSAIIAPKGGGTK